MKQTFLLIVLIFWLTLNGKAQDNNNSITTYTDSSNHKIEIGHELGLNGTYFLRQIISLSDTTIAVSPYLLTYKMMFGNNGIRAGIGARYKKEKQSDENFEDSTSDITYTIDARLGYEIQKAFHKRWTACVGLDAVFQQNSEKFVADSGFDVFTEELKRTGFGAGPILGLYFHLNKNLSLYTEGAFYFLQKKENLTRDFINFPQFNNTSDTKDINELETYIPATLYFIFRF